MSWDLLTLYPRHVLERGASRRSGGLRFNRGSAVEAHGQNIARCTVSHYCTSHPLSPSILMPKRYARVEKLVVTPRAKSERRWCACVCWAAVCYLRVGSAPASRRRKFRRFGGKQTLCGPHRGRGAGSRQCTLWIFPPVVPLNPNSAIAYGAERPVVHVNYRFCIRYIEVEPIVTCFLFCYTWVL